MEAEDAELSRTEESPAAKLDDREPPRETKGLSQGMAQRPRALRKGEESEKMTKSVYAEDDGNLSMDFDINGERELRRGQVTQPLCIISKSKGDDTIVSAFSTTELQVLVAGRGKLMLPPEPKTMKEALSVPHAQVWAEELKEYDLVIKQSTWELKELPPWRKAIRVKRVLKINTNAKGELGKFKALLVGRDYLGQNVHIKNGRDQLGLQAHTEKLKAKEYLLSYKRTQEPIGVYPNTGSEEEEPTKAFTYLCQSVEGRNIVAASTVQKDMQLARSKLAQGRKKPTLLHRKEVPKAMRNLNDTSSYTLTYTFEPGKQRMLFAGYEDANFPPESGKAYTGYMFLVKGTSTSWASKKQSAPAISLTKEEIVAAVSTTLKEVSLRPLWAEMGRIQMRPRPLYADNPATVILPEGEKRLEFAKHIYNLLWLSQMVQEVCLVQSGTDD